MNKQYNEQQKSALGKLLQDRFMSGEAEGYEIVVALMAMIKDGRLKEKDVQPILMTVHSHNAKGVIRSLAIAKELLDEEMIDSILADINPPSS